MTRIRLAAGAVAMAAAALTVSQIASADSGQAAHDGVNRGRPCSAARDAGLFGFVASGQALPGNVVGLPAGPFESSGIIDLLPDGTFHTTHQTVSLNGVASHISQSGTWTVTPDCAITVTVLQGTTRDVTEGAIQSDGNEIVAIDTSQGIAASLTSKRINTHS